MFGCVNPKSQTLKSSVSQTVTHKCLALKYLILSTELKTFKRKYQNIL